MGNNDVTRARDLKLESGDEKFVTANQYLAQTEREKLFLILFDKTNDVSLIFRFKTVEETITVI